MTTRRLFLDDAFLPSGWATAVALDIENGTLTAVTPNASPENRERLPGIALPGLPNLHSHTFQRAMTGLSEVRGPTGDSFWTWRQVMYAFLQRLTPDDVESIAAFAMMEMLESGFTALAEFHYLHHAPGGRPYDNPAELSAIARSGAVIGLCPITEANLGDGIFDATTFRDAGGRFGVGTDSNVEITAPGELRLLEYAQRLHRRARNVMPVREGASTGRFLYESALAGGAQATGRRVGRLAAGCRADLVLLDPSHPDLVAAPPPRRLDAYLFSAGASAVMTTLVAGRTLVTAGRHHARDAITTRYRNTMTSLV